MENFIKFKESNYRYEINHNGVVRKCYEEIVRSNGRKQIINEKIITPILNPYGYLKVRCRVNGKVKNIYIHTLVGKYFVSGHFNGAQINHKNGIKIDNNYRNLEWCTCKENINHAWVNGLSDNKHSKKPIVIDNIRFHSLIDAAKRYKVERQTIYKARDRGYFFDKISKCKLYVSEEFKIELI